jgi:diguanylate cyclase (GGDEF)-like protein
MRELSERRLTAGYLLALGLIALLTLASHLTLNRVLAEHEGSAAIVNVSGRQRMLSQRIASLAAQYQLGSPTAKGDLKQAIEEFQTAHEKLLAQSFTPGTGAGANPYHAIYFGGAVPLDSEVRAYIELARRISDAPPSPMGISGDLAKLLAQARSPLLYRLHEVVQLHQTDSEAQLARLQLMQRITLLIVLATLAFEALVIFRPMVRRIARDARELLHLATVDSLTGALNRASFLQHSQIEIFRAERHGRPLAALMVDADHFKQINDRFGHAGGDAALRALAQTLREATRPSDLVGRLGGEEFAVLLPETPRDAALVLAERLRRSINEMQVNFGGDVIRMTISIGVASRGTFQADIASLLQDADHALYAAKTGGRNRVVDTARIPAIA